VFVKLKLVDKRPLFANVETFRFEPQQPISWQPGQYMHYVFPHPGQDERGEERWFTISSPPYEREIAITTRFTDKNGSSFKDALKNLNPGNTIEADGPKGKFVIDDTSKKAVLVAGGIGVTPYHSMLLQMDHDGQPINADLLYANRDQNFVFDDEFRQLEKKHPNFHVHKFVGDRHIEKADIKPYADNHDNIIYLSGPEPMVENYEKILIEVLGLPEERVRTDFFPGYEAF
jgi:ferredoxin-NADP reductase